MSWLGDFFENVAYWLMKKDTDKVLGGVTEHMKENIIPTGDIEPAAAIPAPLKMSLPWDGKHKDAALWTAHLISEIKVSKLLSLDLDGSAFFPDYPKLSKEEKVIFWANLFSIMAKYESAYKPATVYEEAFPDAKGVRVISRGLLQISIESANGYGCKLNNAGELHDPLINLTCGVKIAEHLCAKHGRISGKNDKGKWQGLSLYWAVMRFTNGTKPRAAYNSIKEHMQSLFDEKKPAPKVEAPKNDSRAVLRKSMQHAAVKNAERDLNETESHGKNRSPFIDWLHDMCGLKGQYGNPYCAMGYSVRVIEDTCKQFNLKNPHGRTTSSQYCATVVPKKYHRKPGEKAQMADGHIEQRYDKPTHGHVGLVSKDQTDPKKYEAIDYNSNAAGDFDGEGVDRVIRSIDGDRQKKHRAFVNWIDWVLDFNGIK